jgi:hypothetical protein
MGKTGFVSRKLWQDFFFKGAKERWTRQAWKNLCLMHYCKPYRSNRMRDLYVLNRSNRLVQALVGNNAVTSPWESQLEHDELLYRGILAAEKLGYFYEWKSEGQLKSVDGDKVVFQIKAGDKKAKYPDAILCLNKTNESKLVAIECEKTQKEYKRYVAIMDAYSRIRAISAVFFITDSPAIQNAIKNAMNATHYPEATKPVLFISEADWLKGAKKQLEAVVPLSCRSGSISSFQKG